MIKRRKSREIQVGSVTIGGDAPVSIQSMTNTDTRDAAATMEQIARLADAGCQIIRLAVPDMEAAEAFGRIRKASPLPMVADIHFDYRLALAAMENGADKVRINPGNIGSKERVEAVLAKAKERGIPIRIGVNSGSLEKELLEKYGGVTAGALCESAMNMIRYVEAMDFDHMVVSLKSSDVALNDEAHKLIGEKMDYPLHIGITESGTAEGGKVKSAVGIGSLLLSGIGDTIRVSLTGDPVNEVIFAKEILKSVGLRKTGINLISCPTCGRTRVDLPSIAGKVERALPELEREMDARGLPGITLAVMGCEVNGPGEAREADFGIACGKGKGVLIRKGEIIRTIEEENICTELIAYLREQLLTDSYTE